MILELVNVSDKSLKTKCDNVDDFESTGLEDLVSDMTETMYFESGVGISAPQVGVCKRIIVIDNGPEYGKNPVVMINPVIIFESEQSTVLKEGCLSFPGLEVDVVRPYSVVVRYQGVSGGYFESTFSNLSSHIVQHEIDHLNGHTLLSKISRLKRSKYIKRILKKQNKKM